jgi:hypothetical protein
MIRDEYGVVVRLPDNSTRGGLFSDVTSPGIKSYQMLLIILINFNGIIAMMCCINWIITAQKHPNTDVSFIPPLWLSVFVCAGQFVLVLISTLLLLLRVGISPDINITPDLAEREDMIVGESPGSRDIYFGVAASFM